jgi:hypothetical protein
MFTLCSRQPNRVKFLATEFTFDSAQRSFDVLTAAQAELEAYACKYELAEDVVAKIAKPLHCFRNVRSSMAREGGVSSRALTGSTSVTGRRRSSPGHRNTISATRCNVFGREPTFAALWRARLAARVMGPDCAGTTREYLAFLRPLGAERRSTRGAHQIIAVVRLREWRR